MQIYLTACIFFITNAIVNIIAVTIGMISKYESKNIIPTIMDEDNEPICKMTAIFLKDCNPYNTLHKNIKPLSGCPYLFEHQLSDWNEE